MSYQSLSFLLFSSLLLGSCVGIRVQRPAPTDPPSPVQQQQIIITQCSPDFDPLDDSGPSNSRVLGFLPNLIPANTNITSNLSNAFSQSTSSNKRRTTVQICHRDFSVLDVTWDVFDSNILANQVACDLPFVESDFVAVLFANPSDSLNNYIEAQVNPLGSLYANIAQVDSINGKNAKCTKTLTTPISCQKSGIYYSAVQLNGRYKANLSFPVKLITGTEQVQHIKANFIRSDWNQTGSEYASWLPVQISPDCTHQSPTFGDLLLV